MVREYSLDLSIIILVQDGCTALHIATQNGLTDTVQALMDRGAQVDLPNWVRYSLE